MPDHVTTETAFVADIKAAGGHLTAGGVMTTARWAGLTYLFLIITGAFSIAYAPGQHMVAGDAAATLGKLQGNVPLFKAAIIAELACYTSFVLLAVLLHKVLRSWSETLALLMIGFVFVSVPIGYVAVAEKFSALHLLTAGAGQAAAIDAHLSRYADIRTLTEIFWGLWLLPYGLLVLKSGAIPRLFGIALILGCCSYMASIFVPFFWDGYSASLFGQLAGIPGLIGEVGGAVWLAAFGAGGWDLPSSQ